MTPGQLHTFASEAFCHILCRGIERSFAMTLIGMTLFHAYRNPSGKLHVVFSETPDPSYKTGNQRITAWPFPPERLENTLKLLTGTSLYQYLGKSIYYVAKGEKRIAIPTSLIKTEPLARPSFGLRLHLLKNPARP